MQQYQAYPSFLPSSSSSRILPSEVDAYGRSMYSDQHARSILSDDPHMMMGGESTFQDPRMVLLDPSKQMNPYEDLKRQMICSLSYEIQLAMTSPDTQMGLTPSSGGGEREGERGGERGSGGGGGGERGGEGGGGMLPQDFTHAACQLDLPLLVAILDSREQWEGLEEGSALSNSCASVSSSLGIATSLSLPPSSSSSASSGMKLPAKAKESLSRNDRLVRIEEATAELKYTVDRVLNPLYDFVAYRDYLLQHQCITFRQLIKQICELQPHYNDLSMNFETLCQHLRKRPRPPKSLLEKREDDLK